MTQLQARVAGATWLDDVCPWGDVVFSTGEHGCLEASFGFLRGRNARTALRTGEALDLMLGAGSNWVGVISEVDHNEGVVHAHGYATEAASYLALDGSGNATATPSTAVDQAAVRGWGISGRPGVPTTPYTSAADGVNTVADLLSAQADELGQWWRVEADRVVRMAAATTTPTYLVAEPLDLGTAGDDFASVLKVRYRSGVSTFATATVVDAEAVAFVGYREEPVDATPLGVITSTRATTVGQGLLAKGRSRLLWTNTLELSSMQLLTMGGLPANLALVKSHQMVRLPVNDNLRTLVGRPFLDVVIGETAYSEGADTVSVSPLGSVAQSLDEVIADLAKGQAA